MKKSLIHMFIQGIVAMAFLMMSGCSDDAFDDAFPQENEPATGCVYIRFSVKLDDNGVSGRSRADAGASGSGDAGVEETPGTSMENAINTVDLLVFDVKTGMLVDVVCLSEEQVRAISTIGGVCVPIYAKKGMTLTICAAVNMTAAMRSKYIGVVAGSDVAVSAVNDVNDYWTVINEFVPGSDGKQSTFETVGKGGMPMTGVFREGKSGSGKDKFLIEELHTTKDEAFDITANVSRIVAKVHLLAELADDGTPQYVRAVNSTDATPDNRDNPSNWVGWIRRENVRYMPNGTNKSTFLFEQPNNSPKHLSALKDPNMDISRYVVDGKFSARLWGPDYVWHDGNKMQDELSLSTCRMGTAEAFSAVRMDNTKSGSDSDDRYTEGMYCLENYFDTPADDAFFENYDDAIPAATHISIAAKLIPRVIMVEKSFVSDMETFIKDMHSNPDETLKSHNLRADDFTGDDEKRWAEIKAKYFGAPSEIMGCLEIVTAHEDDARCILDWSLMLRSVYVHGDAEIDGGYPSGTFYVFDRRYDADFVSGQRYQCLTAGAVFLATGEFVSLKSRAVPHIGGWGYYFTYIDNNGTANGGRIPYSVSQVTRNVYYIINVSNFGFPGGSKSDPEFIKVNTDNIGWDYKGQGNIILH